MDRFLPVTTINQLGSHKDDGRLLSKRKYNTSYLSPLIQNMINSSNGNQRLFLRLLAAHMPSLNIINVVIIGLRPIQCFLTNFPKNQLDDHHRWYIGKEATVVHTSGTESGHIIITTIGDRNVLKHKRYKNREQQTMRLLDHPNFNLCIVVVHRHVQELLDEDKKRKKNDAIPALRPLNSDDFIQSKKINLFFLCRSFLLGPSFVYDATSMNELR
ncbi:hypothetical protein LXL04_016391 [Taraxacum kok-saghyz]